MMTLNGQVVSGFNMRLRLGFRLADEELSGQSASTARAEQGIKAQTLNVSLEIKQSDADELTRLVTMARSIEADGNRTVYTIVNQLAAACKIRHVVFTDNFTVNEQSDTRAWRVSFVLAERQSRAEALENRQTQANDTKASTNSFETVSEAIDRTAI